MSYREEMMIQLDEAVKFSYCPISNFKVGCVARASSGKYYLGANVEITLLYNLHAEQASVHNAIVNGEKEITHICLNELPCGICRQFLYEINHDMVVYVNDGEYILKDLLPYAFSPSDLGNKTLFKDYKHDSGFTYSNHITNFYINKGLYEIGNHEFRKSYSPYNKSECVVSLVMSDDTLYNGIYIENCAFNPSILPVLGAISQMILNDYNKDKYRSFCITVGDDNTLDHEEETKYILNKYLSFK